MSISLTPTTGPIASVIEQAIESKRIVGTVVMVAVDGQPIFEGVAGFSDRENGISMHRDSIFRLASVTKSLVAALAMQMVEQGRIDLSDDVRQYLPEFRPQLKTGDEAVITLRHLLLHTSGLTYGFAEPPSSLYHQLHVSDGVDQPGLSLEENLYRLGQTVLRFAPGQRWNYSLGLDVLGGVIERVLGQRLGDAVQERIRQPLGLVDTAFHVADTARLVVPYADGKPEPVAMFDGIKVASPGGASVVFAPSRILNPDSYHSGGSGMAGTAPDLMRFFETIRTGGAPILKSATVEEMMRDHVGAGARAQGPGWGFGYGWAVLDAPQSAKSPQSAGTIEWGGAYGNRWFIDPVRKVTAIILTNTAFEGVFGAFPFAIRNAIYQTLDGATDSGR